MGASFASAWRVETTRDASRRGELWRSRFAPLAGEGSKGRRFYSPGAWVASPGRSSARRGRRGGRGLRALTWRARAAPWLTAGTPWTANTAAHPSAQASTLALSSLALSPAFSNILLKNPSCRNDSRRFIASWNLCGFEPISAPCKASS